MPAERYYYPEDFQEGNPISLADIEFHHLVNVMRNRIGDTIELINGKGQLAIGRIEEISKKAAKISVESISEASVLEKPLILAQAIPRLSKLEFVLEKGTELGVTEIWLFPATYSDKSSFSKNQLDRFNTILVSAMKQCGRLFLPELILMPRLEEWQTFCLPAFYGDTDPNAPLFEVMWKKIEKKGMEGTIFCIGPESGFTSQETVSLKALGATGVKLNPFILRTETAAIVAMSLMAHWQQYDEVLDKPQ